MKKSISLSILIFISVGVYFLTYSEIDKILMTIVSSIFTTGYFIVKQLEENEK